MNELYSALQDKLQMLVDRCQQLEQEKTQLQVNEKNWRTERAELIQKNEQVRTKIDTMINRLRALEQTR